MEDNGTAGGTALVKDINLAGDSSPSGFKVFNNALYFSPTTALPHRAVEDRRHGTVQVKDINLGPGGSDPFRFTVFGTALYFSADDGVTGPELWRTDGTEGNTVLVKDINANPGTGSLVSELTVFGPRCISRPTTASAAPNCGRQTARTQCR